MSGPRTAKTLVVGPAWVGDMVMAQSLFRLLSERDPGARLEVLAPGWTRPLLERMPEVDAALEMPLGHGQLGLRARYRLGRDLARRGYTRAIVLPNSWKSALVPYWARIPRRTGFLGELRLGLLNDPRWLGRAALPMTVQRFVSLGLPRGAPLPDPLPRPRLRVSAPAVVEAREAVGIPGDGPVLALCPGAEFGEAKRWPEAYYAELARHWREQGWRVWLFGSERDRPVCARIAAEVPQGCLDLAGRTSLAQAVDLLSLADRVVSNDSGLMHVAAALGRPLVAIYGSSDPGFTPPLSPGARIERLHLECSPCFKRECPLGHLNCLRGLRPRRIIRAVAELPAP